MWRTIGFLGVSVLFLAACGDTGGAGNDPLFGAGGEGGIGGTTAGSGGSKAGSGGAGAGGSTIAGQGGSTTAGIGGDGGSTTAGQGGEGGSGGAPCASGTILCDGATKQVCDGKGGFSEETVCSNVCAEGLGCVVCTPGTGKCEGNQAQQCKLDGSGYETSNCDPELGLTCQSALGTCSGPCAPENLSRSYIGCEYFPTVTSNGGLFSGFSFAIVIANTSPEEATITVRRKDQVIVQEAVAPKSLKTIKLPWVEELRNDISNASTIADLDKIMQSELIAGGAYHVKSTRPVTVYQFNPLEFQIKDPGGCPKLGSPDCNSYTNDASLLLPINALGNEYFVASAPPLISAQGLFPKQYVQLPGFVAITATSDNTNLTVTSSSYIRSGTGIPEMTPGGKQSFTLQRGDVIQLLSGKVPDAKVQGCQSNVSGSDFCTSSKEYDLTGTLLAADKPIMVIGGHDCSRTPYNKAACDHLEESMFPTNTLGTDVLVTAPQAVKTAASGDGKPDQYMLRVLSAVDGNAISVDPPIAPSGMLNRGQYADIPLTNQDVMVKATGPILVAQYMLSADQVDPGNSGTPQSQGDPSFSLGIPSAQYRDEYTFLAPESYKQNFVNIAAPTNSVVVLDGQEITINGPPVGNTGFSVLRKKITGGAHTATSTQPFGIVVYGYGQYTSYMYPGGLNLNKL